MKWPWPPPTRKDMLVIIVVVLIGCGLVFFQASYPNSERSKSNFGFGPEWECIGVPKGGPICIKKKP